MVCFSNAKINLGLNIISKREDGYHNLETIFYPIGLCDALEIIETKNKHTGLFQSGIPLNIENEQNICVKAYKLLENEYQLPPIDIYLHKVIPSGAGLGGGSSNAAFMLKMLNDFFKLGLSTNEIQNYSAQLGSDCAFFIENKPVFAYGRGELFEPISLDLSNKYIYLIKPDVSISTAEAYRLVRPAKPHKSLNELIKEPIENWEKLIFNDFEESIFKKNPELEKIKYDLYHLGAIYASMSGSGSSIYGIFNEKPFELKSLKNSFSWISKI